MLGGNTIKYWIVAIRPFALPVFFLLPLTGYALQYGIGKIGWDIVLLSIGTMFVGIFVHLYNNYDDYMRGVDKLNDGSKGKYYTSASQLLPKGKIKPKSMLMGAVFSFILSAIFGGVVLIKYWDSIIPGALGLFFALSYNVFEFKYRALGGVSFAGSVISAILVGAMMNTLTPSIVIWVLVLFLGYVGFVVVNIDSYYDIETDKKNKVMTFPMLHPRLFVWMVWSLIILAIAIGMYFVVVSPLCGVSYVLLLLLVVIAVCLYKSLSSEKFVGLAVIAIIFLLIAFIWW